MARFEDGPNLFGLGAGWSTCGDFTCARCGTKYNEGNDAEERYNDDPINLTEFAGMMICCDCFEAVEQEVLHRMDDIIPWYKRILAARRAALEKSEGMLTGLPVEAS